LEDLDTPEEAASIYTDPQTGLSYSIINKNEGSTFEDLQRAINGGYASPEMFATVGTLMGGGQFKIVQKKKFLGFDQLMPDTELNLDVNTPIYQTSDKDVYAVRESDVREGGDSNKFLRVEASLGKSGITNLNVLGEDVAPKFMIDPVIVVPSPDGGLERIYLKRNPVTGAIESYYSERRNRVLQMEELEPLLRGKGLSEVVAPGGEVVTPSVEQPTVVAPQPDRPSIVQRAAGAISGIASGGVSLPSFNYPSIKTPEFLQPSAAELQTGISMRGGEYDQPQKIPLLPDVRPSEILAPTTTTGAIVGGLLRGGAAIQTQLQKVPLIGKLFQ
jgi:hypothetical protein